MYFGCYIFAALCSLFLYRFVSAVCPRACPIQRAVSWRGVNNVKDASTSFSSRTLAKPCIRTECPEQKRCMWALQQSWCLSMSASASATPIPTRSRARGTARRSPAIRACSRAMTTWRASFAWKRSRRRIGGLTCMFAKTSSGSWPRGRARWPGLSRTGSVAARPSPR